MNDSISRRTVLKGLGAGLATAASPEHGRAEALAPPLLTVETRVLEVKGKAATVYGIRNEQGGQGFNMVLAPEFRARVVNATQVETLIHWHGLTPPLALDGVPMLSGPTLKPGESKDYVFPNREAGTHWMHSHVGLQEQQLLAAPLIIRETETPLYDEQEHTVMLHDFTFRDPAEILAELRSGGGGHAAHGQMMDHSQHMGHGNMAGQEMPMAAAHNDVVFDAFLANDRTLDDPEVVQSERGGRFRLRIINASAASNLWIDLGALSGELIAVDGKVVKPVKGTRFPLAIAQRADIRVTLPSRSGAWPVLFRGEGTRLQSGIILRAGEGAVSKFSDQAETEGAPLDLALEAQLRSLITLPEIAVARIDMLMLSGGGSDYTWSLNGMSGMHDTLFTVREGDRYEVMMHNMTSMAHPMHLHGHYFKVVEISGKRIDGAVRDTVLVPPMETVTILYDATNPGTWAFHCHHVYHMNSGMMGSIRYADAA